MPQREGPKHQEWIVQYREAFRQSALQFDAAILLNPQDPRVELFDKL